MGRSQETFNKKEVRNKKQKKRKEKAVKKQAKAENDKKSSFDDMIAYVDENGVITSTPPEENKDEVKLEDIEIGVPKKESDENDDPSAKTGVVDYFNDSKGFGFIRDSQTKKSLFVHINDVEGEIKQGNKVSFDEQKGQKGPVAKNVQIVT
jgi:cold shock CspA family protein